MIPTPILGPSAIVLARHVARTWGDTPVGYLADLTTLGHHLGLGRGGGRYKVTQTLARLASFGVARYDGSAFYLRTDWPHVPAERLDRLPAQLRLQLEQLHPGGDR